MKETTKYVYENHCDRKTYFNKRSSYYEMGNSEFYFSLSSLRRSLCGSDGKESACNVGDLGLIPGSGSSSEKGMTIHSCLENLINRGAWWATVHGITKSWT